MAAYTSSSDPVKVNGVLQAPAHILNDKPAALQDLSRESIALVDDSYSAASEYSITFTPFSYIKKVTQETDPTKT